MSEQVELAKLFKSVLQLCKVREGETLAVLTENGERGGYAAAYLAAAQELGAYGFQVNLGKRPMGP